MRCPFCSSEDTQVKDSRQAEDGNAVRRRRLCSKCGGRFTTFERVQLRDLQVLKNSGKRAPFDRDKLMRSVRIALQKRPVDEERVEQMVSGIVRQLESSGQADVTSNYIGELVMEGLSGLDKIAYVRYASVYRDFRATEDFGQFIESENFATKASPMFTGIITDVGRLREVTRVTGSEWGDTRMIVETAYDTQTINIGASIAHSGACMTVVEKGQDQGQNWYAFDVSDESLDKTTLGDWAVGQAINLERALTGADELGGHMVTGHVDTTARCVSRDAVAGSTRFRIAVPEDLAFGIAPKGSVTVDGISLTVNDVSDGTFMINIIPHTAEVTTLGRLQPGDEVNLEIDVIARYVARYLSHMKA